MSLFYGTDEKIIRSTEISSDAKHPSQMRWHKLLDICREKGVTESHFRSYMGSKMSSFGDEETFLFDCMKKNILKFNTQDVILESDERIIGEDGEELEDDPDGVVIVNEEIDNKKYNYYIDTENPDCKKFFQKYIKAQLSKSTNGELSFDNVMSNVKNNLLKYGEIDGLDEYFEQLKTESLYDFVSVYHSKIHDFYQEGEKFDYKIEKANRDNIDSVKQTQKLNETLDGAKKVFGSENRTNTVEKNNVGDVLVDELQTEVRLHRGHSLFFVVFHPIKYYREAKSISNAKNTLVDLGANREKVNEFVENVKLEDKYFRDKKDFVKAKAVNSVYLNLRFDSLVKGDEIPEDEIDDLVMEDDEKSVNEFTEQLAENINKSDNTVENVPVDNAPVENKEPAKENSADIVKENI